MLWILCTKYGKNPSWTEDATGRTRKVNGQTEGQTDRWTDRQGESNIPPTNFVAGGIIRLVILDTLCVHAYAWCSKWDLRKYKNVYLDNVVYFRWNCWFEATLLIWISMQDCPVTPNSIRLSSVTQIARIMGPIWGPPGSCGPQAGPM